MVLLVFLFSLILQAPDGETQPSVPVELFVSTERVLILNKDLDVRCLCIIPFISRIG